MLLFRRGGGRDRLSGDACVAHVLVLAYPTAHHRATQASPPHIHSSPAPTETTGLFLALVVSSNIHTHVAYSGGISRYARLTSTPRLRFKKYAPTYQRIPTITTPIMKLSDSRAVTPKVELIVLLKMNNSIRQPRTITPPIPASVTEGMPKILWPPAASHT